MNVGEITETTVNELGEGSEGAVEDEGLTTTDYLELLLQKNRIPRTQQQKQAASL